MGSNHDHLIDGGRFRNDRRAGMVTVDLATAGVELQAPFGGTRASRMGAGEQGTDVRESHTQPKTGHAHA